MCCKQIFQILFAVCDAKYYVVVAMLRSKIIFNLFPWNIKYIGRYTIRTTHIHTRVESEWMKETAKKHSKKNELGSRAQECNMVTWRRERLRFENHTVNNFQLLALSHSFCLALWFFYLYLDGKEEKLAKKIENSFSNTKNTRQHDTYLSVHIYRWMCIDLHVPLVCFHFGDEEKIEIDKEGTREEKSSTVNQQQCRELKLKLNVFRWIFALHHFCWTREREREDWSQSNKLFTLQRNTLPSLSALLLMMGTIELVSVAIAIRSGFFGRRASVAIFCHKHW